MTTLSSADGQARNGFERVHIELDWYDGPRSGLADIDGEPHYFQAVFDGGINARYDELTAQFGPHRAMLPGAQRLAAEWRRHPGNRTTQYHPDGPSYLVRWRPMR
jgi:hypothetical protein